MRFFADELSLDEIKSSYRRLVMVYHPDHGGDNEMMKKINFEYSRRIKQLGTKPNKLSDVKVGHIVFVNRSKCLVTEVYEDYFRARSIVTNREAYFSKSTGFAMLNFRFQARVW